MIQEAFPNVHPGSLIGAQVWLMENAHREEIANALVQIDELVQWGGKTEVEAVEHVFGAFIPVWVGRQINPQGLENAGKATRYHLIRRVVFTEPYPRYFSLCGNVIRQSMFKCLVPWDLVHGPYSRPLAVPPKHCQGCVMSARAMRRKGKLIGTSVNLERVIGPPMDVYYCRPCGWHGSTPKNPTSAPITLLSRDACPKCGAPTRKIWAK